MDGKVVAVADIPNPFVKKAQKDGLLLLEVGQLAGLVDEVRISTSVR
jgi:hypothetical protein